MGLFSAISDFGEKVGNAFTGDGWVTNEEEKDRDEARANRAADRAEAKSKAATDAAMAHIKSADEAFKEGKQFAGKAAASAGLEGRKNAAEIVKQSGGSKLAQALAAAGGSAEATANAFGQGLQQGVGVSTAAGQNKANIAAGHAANVAAASNQAGLLAHQARESEKARDHDFLSSALSSAAGLFI